jgi:hypothetical protein
MKPIDKLLGSALKLKRTSLALTNSFGRNSVVNNRDQRKILEQRKKNQQERLKTFRSAIDAVKQKEQDSGNKTNALLGGLGLSALVGGGALGRMRGAKPMVPGGKPRSVRVPTGGLRRPGVLPKGRVSGIGGPLNVAFAGVDFAMRKGSGQTNLQAGAGAGAGLLGGLGGMKAGAVAGGAIGAMFGGVGAIPGAAIGGVLGSLLGGSLASGVADSITGADARRIEETKRSGMMLAKTPFGTGLDSFERALGKLEKLNTLCYVESEPVEAVEPKGTDYGGFFGEQGPKPEPGKPPGDTPEETAAALDGVASFTGKVIPKELYGILIELQKEYLETGKTASRMTDFGFLKVGATAPNRLIGGPDMSPRISFNPKLTPESNERAVSQMELAGGIFNLPATIAPFLSVLGMKGAFGQRKPAIPKAPKQPVKISTPKEPPTPGVSLEQQQRTLLEMIFKNQSATPATPAAPGIVKATKKFGSKSTTPVKKETSQGNPMTEQESLMKRLEREYPEGIPQQALQQLNPSKKPSLQDRINEQIHREQEQLMNMKLGGGEKVSMILPVEEGQNQQPMMGGGGSGGGVRVISGPSDAKVARYIIDALSQTTA